MLYTLWVDEHVSGFASRYDVRVAIEKALSGPPVEDTPVANVASLSDDERMRWLAGGASGQKTLTSMLGRS